MNLLASLNDFVENDHKDLGDRVRFSTILGQVKGYLYGHVAILLTIPANPLAAAPAFATYQAGEKCMNMIAAKLQAQMAHHSKCHFGDWDENDTFDKNQPLLFRNEASRFVLNVIKKNNIVPMFAGALVYSAIYALSAKVLLVANGIILGVTIVSFACKKGLNFFKNDRYNRWDD